MSGIGYDETAVGVARTLLMGTVSALARGSAVGRLVGVGGAVLGVTSRAAMVTRKAYTVRLSDVHREYSTRLVASSRTSAHGFHREELGPV